MSGMNISCGDFHADDKAGTAFEYFPGTPHAFALSRQLQVQPFDQIFIII
jgi:hypothetical protein